MTDESTQLADRPATLCRLAVEGVRWRVMVESWEEPNGYGGRLVFEPDGPSRHEGPLVGPPSLRGRSREDLVSAAHDLPERRIREVLHSLA